DPPLDWLPRLPREYTRRRVRLATLREARELGEPAFVKPPNDKSFPARVTSAAELPPELPDDSPVLISDIVSFDAEFRCFVLDRSVRGLSVYARGGELQADYEHSAEEEAGVLSFVGGLLDNAGVDLPR